MQTSIPALDHWYWLRFCVRAGLTGRDGNGLFRRLDEQNRSLIHAGLLCPWHAYEATLRLLMACASNRGLAWAWRQQCLEQAAEPLSVLKALAVSEQSKRLVAIWTRQLAKRGLAPSLPLSSRLDRSWGGAAAD